MKYFLCKNILDILMYVCLIGVYIGIKDRELASALAFSFIGLSLIADQLTINIIIPSEVSVRPKKEG